jgi:AbrB family looped-hinge helix DNA binding protein
MMIEITMKIGPKGQVVIPKPFRNAFKMAPGTEVVFSIEEEKLVLSKLPVKASEYFEKMAKRQKKDFKMHPHEPYEKELEERLG